MKRGDISVRGYETCSKPSILFCLCGFFLIEV